MNTSRILEIAPHYVAMLALVYLVLAVVESVVGGLGFLAELVVIAVIVFAYRPLVLRLGLAPSAWEQ